MILRGYEVKIAIYWTLILTFSTATFGAKFRSIETTRLVSTSGAGVASLLVSEASILNPSVIAFYKNTSIYAHRLKGEIEETSRTTPKEFKETLYVATDTSGKFKGALAYFKQENLGSKREQFNLSFAKPMGKKAAFGMIYQYIKDYDDGEIRLDGEHTASMGVTYIHNTNLIFGAVFQDLAKKIKHDQKVTVGLQYNFTKFLMVMLDHGFHYGYSYRENNYSSLALQTSIYKDIYLKGGVFNNKYLSLEGFSWGSAGLDQNLVLNTPLEIVAI